MLQRDGRHGETSSYSSVAKLGVLAGSAFAATFGAIALAHSSAPITKHADRVAVAGNH